MGSYPVPSEPYEYCHPSTECQMCFPPGKSPLYLYFAVSGVMKGGGSDPDIIIGPNGFYKVKVVAPCYWNSTSRGMDCFYDQRGAASLVFIRNSIGDWTFTSVGQPYCTMFYANDFQDPVNDDYYGGFCSVGYFPPVGTESYVDKAAEFNIISAADLYLTARAKSATEAVYAYQQKRGRTNIKILYEET